MYFFSKQYIKHGTAIIKGKTFNYSFFDDCFDFVPTKDLSKLKSWKPFKPKDLKKLNVVCHPFGEEDIVAEMIGTHDSYPSYNHSLRCFYEKLFIHREHYTIDALMFSGPSVDQLVQNITLRREIEKGTDLQKVSLLSSFSLFGKQCDLTTITVLNNDDECEIGFKSTICFHFVNSCLTKEEAFSLYEAFIRLTQFLGYRHDIYFSCDTFETRGDSVYPNGSIYLPIISEKNIDRTSKLISLESVLPIIGDLLQFVIDKNIVPLFIPNKKSISFSDSYIIATSWAQMVFKQIYIPSNPNYTIRRKKAYDNATGKNISFKDQLSEMIVDSFSYISDFAGIAFPVMLSNINVNQYTSEDLPKRLKTVRNAIAHGSTNPGDYDYTHLDLTILLCAIYSAIFKKRFGLDDAHLKLALSELFFDSTEVFSQWQELRNNE